MARPLRLEYPGAWYHVMNRGGNKNPIFFDLDDRKNFMNVLRDTIISWKVSIHAYSLMDNHYHLLMETPLGNLSRAMKYIDGVYTQKINRKYERDGAIFRGRYKSILVEKDNYALQLVRYIHMNGVSAGLYKDAREDKNSSHRRYMDMDPYPKWLERNTILKMISDDKRVAKRKLDEFINRGVSNEIDRVMEAKKWPAMLGAKAFIRDIKSKFSHHFRPAPIQRGQIKRGLTPLEEPLIV